ncbi:cyclin-D1-1-like isoform X2 [Humulus lupulus]|uniref:cyclin-D1-1-like isoform X2 n=1 Tax=Humulus lupulus TaxID=3486 RepID=UPI002B4092D9|nr:cyclin-D1-1-like isoform X2 [Humulus lupulus]
MSSESTSAAASSSSSLYCSEDGAGLDSPYADEWISDHSPYSLPFDETTITELFDSETHYMPEPEYLRRCCDRSMDVTDRQDFINWILRVHAFYHFCPVTAFLAVNYFDRFLSSHSILLNGWSFQLLSVACLSVAAKMEEPRVPLLLDLQTCDPKYIFEAKTVERMELLVMTNLDWRLRSVTPYDFLHHFISKLPSSTSCPDIHSASSDLILNTARVSDFLGFTPSMLAAAAVLCAARECLDSQWGPHQEPPSFDERVNNDMVRSCHQLMDEYLVDTCPNGRHNARRVEPGAPPSPAGVLDAAVCGSCDTRSETPGSRSRPEPPSKRLRSSALVYMNIGGDYNL